MRRRIAYGLLGATLLTACEVPAPIEIASPPPPRPERPSTPPSPERSAFSFALEDYYERVQTGLLVRGLLRQDGGGPDVPFDAARLAQTFEDVVFFQEYVRRDTELVNEQTPSTLNRWEGPITIEPVFGETVDTERKARDLAEIDRLIARLRRSTGHPISRVPGDGNFTVFILHEDERAELGNRLKARLPELDAPTTAAILDMPRTRYCLVVQSDPANDGVLTRAVAIIRAEHPHLLRVGCLHEEIAQGLGLQNDSDTARPSIFTDEEEFGRLTTMDEYLLAMLYDPRLTPGMTLEEARPVIAAIAAELLPGDGT